MRVGDNLWDFEGKRVGAGFWGLLSNRGWRLLMGPGVRWRSLTVLARLLISRFSVRFRVGALDLRDRRDPGPTTRPTTFLSCVLNEPHTRPLAELRLQRQGD